VRAVLILPDEAVASTKNETLIGTINGGTSASVSWTVVFKRNGTYNLQVRASGFDSNNSSCTASQSITIAVGASIQRPQWILYTVLVSVGMIFLAITASVLVLRKSKRAKPTPEAKHS
jgi:hypothetical protein